MKITDTHTDKSKANNTWRFIDTGASDGVFNMSVDEALTCNSTSSEPILRVYRWQPFTISIGHNQNINEINLNKCKNEGVGIVRRPTGGRAIFHAHEVTYCVIIPKDSILYQKNTHEIYSHISSALVDGLHNLGMPVKLDRQENTDPDFSKHNQRFACFATTARYEIHYKTKKLVGSAQRRYENAVLQHGSIILGIGHLQLFNYLSDKGNGKLQKSQQQLQEKTVCIDTILKRNVSYEEVVQNLKTGFEKYFGIHFLCNPLTSEELSKIEGLKPNYSELRRNSP